MDDDLERLTELWILTFCEAPVLVDAELMRRVLADYERDLKAGRNGAKTEARKPERAAAKPGRSQRKTPVKNHLPEPHRQPHGRRIAGASRFHRRERDDGDTLRPAQAVTFRGDQPCEP